MTLQNLAGLIDAPSLPWVGPLGNNQGFTSFLIDAAAEKVALSFMVPKDGNLRKVGFRLGAVTQAPANGLTISLQDFDLTTGDPDGVADATVTVTTGLTANTWVEAQFTADLAVQSGRHLFCVIEFTSFSASDSLNISALNPPGGAIRTMFMYSSLVDHFTASWAKSAASVPVLYVEYDDGSTVPIRGCWPALAFNTTAITTTTTPDEIGRRMYFPFPARCIGLWAYVNDLNNGAAFDLVLYEGTTAQRTVSFDEDEGTENISGGIAVYFDPFTIAANTEYFAVVKPTLAVGVTIGELEVNAAKHLDAWPGGQACYKVSRVDAGAWTTATTKAPWIGLILDQLDDGAGGGGLRLVGHGGLAA